MSSRTPVAPIVIMRKWASYAEQTMKERMLRDSKKRLKSHFCYIEEHRGEKCSTNNSPLKKLRKSCW